ncbi:MAG: helix-turn-helix domain-containing protein, partial [Treponemataceae bacterium]|nr:helix-turn-helix domain-containing protein [Treponemataceae bacterium]
ISYYFIMESMGKIRLVLAENIKKTRKAKSMTQEQLSELADISNTYIANIECGKSWISDFTLEKISAALGVSPYELFIPEEKVEFESKKNLKIFLKKILLEKEKKLNEEIAALVKKSIKEIRDELVF